MQHGHERKYHGCYIRFKRSSLRLSSQRGTEAGGRGTEALLLKKAVKKNNLITAAFQLFCATLLITLRVTASSVCFTLVPEEKLRISSTFKDFGC